jgi:hypothetical protein
MTVQRQIISRIPHQGMSGEQWGVVVENELLEIWIEWLSAKELEEVNKAGLLGASKSAFKKLDEIIIDQAQTVGWRMGLSLLVQFRFSEWDNQQDGPELHDKFRLAVVNSARIMSRQKLPPITDPDQHAVKEETVSELRPLLTNLRNGLALRRSRPSSAEVHQLFLDSVSNAPESYPHLAANAKRWGAFFDANPDTLLPLVVNEKNRVTPASLYDEFLSWCTGWKPGPLREAISRLGKRNRV